MQAAQPDAIDGCCVAETVLLWNHKVTATAGTHGAVVAIEVRDG